ncbi:MAG: DNA methyltransferase [Thermomicrobiales bacterium]
MTDDIGRMKTAGSRLTFKANRDLGRHGWLRLTPAYSVHLVARYAAALGPADRVLDPFCGTGTTALVCRERGIYCDTVDINPFLIWLANAKCAAYAEQDVVDARALIEDGIGRAPQADDWTPPLFNIGRWWGPETLARLASVRRSLTEARVSDRARDLAKVAFCRSAIEISNASHGHQSLSFKSDIAYQNEVTVATDASNTIDRIALAESLRRAIESVGASATARGPFGEGRALLGDARDLRAATADESGGNGNSGYSAVITSPPYPNRMSYVRELRPYMYWLGFLGSGREAGELDWRAIGGTWGIATSNVARWRPDPGMETTADVGETIARIGARSEVLGRYVEKYVHDTQAHVLSLRAVLAPGARLTYIVGNSRFFDVTLSTEEIYAAIFQASGFRDVGIETLRKRTSKKELFEFAVTATWPG